VSFHPGGDPGGGRVDPAGNPWDDSSEKPDEGNPGTGAELAGEVLGVLMVIGALIVIGILLF
jgi:hypothetical protein